jgi:transcriptional regulator with XRE-family HTH domain
MATRSRATQNVTAAASHPAPPPLSRAHKRPTVEGLGDEVGAAELARRVAESLRRYRAERRMSLDQLALSSGVSRAALSQIEGARTNPTLGLMWKVAVGLGIPFQALLGTNDGSQSRVLRSGDAIPLRSTDGRMESRLLSPSGSGDRVEVYELRFQPKGLHRSEAHASGATETVIVLTGALRIVAGEETHDLAAGDTLYFLANVPHSYENRSSREARCIDIIAYGRA